MSVDSRRFLHAARHSAGELASLAFNAAAETNRLRMERAWLRTSPLRPAVAR